MKKKIFIGFAALAVAAVAAWNVYLASAQSNELSDLMLANIEALAYYELPEVVIDCSGGRCRTCSGTLCMSGEYTCYRSVFTGYQSDFCWCPC
jgi:hypothetical protein